MSELIEATSRVRVATGHPGSIGPSRAQGSHPQNREAITGRFRCYPHTQGGQWSQAISGLKVAVPVSERYSPYFREAIFGLQGCHLRDFRDPSQGPPSKEAKPGQLNFLAGQLSQGWPSPRPHVPTEVISRQTILVYRAQGSET